MKTLDKRVQDAIRSHGNQRDSLHELCADIAAHVIEHREVSLVVKLGNGLSPYLAEKVLAWFATFAPVTLKTEGKGKGKRSKAPMFDKSCTLPTGDYHKTLPPYWNMPESRNLVVDANEAQEKATKENEARTNRTNKAAQAKADAEELQKRRAGLSVADTITVNSLTLEQVIMAISALTTAAMDTRAKTILHDSSIMLADMAKRDEEEREAAEKVDALELAKGKGKARKGAPLQDVVNG